MFLLTNPEISGHMNTTAHIITLIGNGDDLFISIITSGGSQAVLFKINTLGEESFLDKAVEIVKGYIRS